MDTPVKTILHMSAEIHVFFRASHALGFGITLQRDAKSPSSLVGVFRGWIGSRVLQLRYVMCSLRVELRRHPKII